MSCRKHMAPIVTNTHIPNVIEKGYCTHQTCCVLRRSSLCCWYRAAAKPLSWFDSHYQECLQTMVWIKSFRTVKKNVLALTVAVQATAAGRVHIKLYRTPSLTVRMIDRWAQHGHISMLALSWQPFAAAGYTQSLQSLARSIGSSPNEKTSCFHRYFITII